MYYDFSTLITICNEISTKLDTVILIIQPILYSICFYILLKIGFRCLRGYKQ